MTTSLVTGAAGFLGSHICDHLLAMGHTVIGLDDLSGGYVENVPAGVIFQLVDITDQRLVDYTFKKYRPDFVFHLAAYAAENLSHWIRNYNYTVNVVGSANLINASIEHGVKRFVFASSAAVYGDSPAETFTEQSRRQPIDPYGIAKLAVERDLEVASRHFGLDYTIFRPHNVYGIRQNIWDSHRNVVGIFMRQCLAGEPMTIYGTGQQRRAFSYIDDVAPYIATSAQMDIARNEIYNIGGDTTYTVLALAEYAAEAMYVEPNIIHLPERHEAKDVSLVHYKLHHDFGIEHSGVPLIKGLKVMANWAKTQPKRAPRVFADIEIQKNLPEHWRQK